MLVFLSSPLRVPTEAPDMCARYTLTRRLSLLVQEMVELMLDEGVLYDWDPPPRYNIAPTQQVAAVRASADAGRNELVPLKWGLIPSWATDPRIATKCINARAETVAETPAFRAAFKRRRCLVLADGYFEWTGPKGKKQPWHFRLQGNAPFAFAGLWEHWRPADGEPIETCTVLTTEANELAAQYHDRMPVILHPVDYSRWLDSRSQRAEELSPLLVPFPDGLMVVNPVSALVNNPRNDSPDCVRVVTLE
jgi:putative SOS response-associated peptidase YedK